MTLKLVPDQQFLTSNISELKAMLESILEEALNYDKDTFEMDLKEVLGPEDKVRISDKMKSYNCDECQFRATIASWKKEALDYHINIKHTYYWNVEKRERVVDKIVDYIWTTNSEHDDTINVIPDMVKEGKEEQINKSEKEEKIHTIWWWKRHTPI